MDSGKAARQASVQPTSVSTAKGPISWFGGGMFLVTQSRWTLGGIPGALAVTANEPPNGDHVEGVVREEPPAFEWRRIRSGLDATKDGFEMVL